MPPRGLGVERDAAELHHRLGGDLLERGAAGDQVLDVRGVLGDLLLRLLERAVVASSVAASSKGVVLAARIALIR